MDIHNGSWDKFQSPLHPVYDTGLALFLVFTGLLAVIGNTLAVLVFTGKGRETTVPELFLLNIAIVDLILALASYPAVTVSAFAHKWLFGNTGCAIYAAVCYFLGLATIMSLATLAAVRYVKTCLPNLGHRVKVRFSKLAFIAIYTYSLFWAAMPFLGWGGYAVEPFGISCTLEWVHFGVWGKAHIITVSVFCVFLPTFVIVASHVAILIRVRQSDKVIALAVPSRRANNAERQLLYTSIGICVGFLIAWLPYATICLFATFGNHEAIPLWATPIPVMLAKSSIAYNPLIYVCCSKRYRVEFVEKFRSLVYCSWGKCNRTCPQTDGVNYTVNAERKTDDGLTFSLTARAPRLLDFTTQTNMEEQQKIAHIDTINELTSQENENCEVIYP